MCRLCLTLSCVSTSYHVNLSVGVAHVANNRAVFHPVQLVSGHHVFVPCRGDAIIPLHSQVYRKGMRK